MKYFWIAIVAFLIGLAFQPAGVSYFLANLGTFQAAAFITMTVATILWLLSMVKSGFKLLFKR